MLLTTLLLGLAICAVWLPRLPAVAGVRIPPWPLLLAGATAAGLASGVLDWRGALATVALCGLAFGSVHLPQPAARRTFATATVLLALALGFNQVPGFQPSVFAQDLQVSADAPPIRLTAHFAPGLAGLVLLAFFARRTRSLHELGAALPHMLSIAAATTFIVIGAAWAAGYVRFDPKLPAITAAHLAKNLLWTCVVEESFFRGVVQQGLAQLRAVRERPGLHWLPIAVASVLFGLAHLPGGWTYAALAALAGVGYGLAYARTGLIEAAMLAHFAVNATHFLLFTYPQLKPIGT
jgi:hypothetical protein